MNRGKIAPNGRTARPRANARVVRPKPATAGLRVDRARENDRRAKAHDRLAKEDRVLRWAKMAPDHRVKENPDPVRRFAKTGRVLPTKSWKN
jgi:hypothetical protein